MTIPHSVEDSSLGGQRITDGLSVHRGKQDSATLRITNDLSTSYKTGVGLELVYNPTYGAYVQAYDREGAAYKDLSLVGRNISLLPQSGGRVIPNLGRVWAQGSRMNGQTGGTNVQVISATGLTVGVWMVQYVGMAYNRGTGPDNYVWYLCSNAGFGSQFQQMYGTYQPNLWESTSGVALVDNTGGAYSGLQLWWTGSYTADLAGDFSRIMALQVG